MSRLASGRAPSAVVLRRESAPFPAARPWPTRSVMRRLEYHPAVGRGRTEKGHRAAHPSDGGRSGGGPTELRPHEPSRDLLDRSPVRLCVEGDLLVGHGFGHQCVAIPRSSVRSLGYYYQPRLKIGPRQGLVVLDDENRMLLRAAGEWNNKRALVAFSGRAGLPPPQHRDAKRLWHRARGYRRLRTSPRGAGLATVLIVVFVLAVSMLAGMCGLLLVRLLPAYFGPARLLAAGVALIGGVIVGAVVAAQAVMYATRALKWLARLLTRSAVSRSATR